MDDTSMAKRKHPAGTPATTALDRAGVPYTVHTYVRAATSSARSVHDTAATSYGLEAAEALGLDPRTVFKTLLASVDDALVVAVVPVTGQLDLKALAAAAGGKKAVMAAAEVAERRTGYVVGGISPLGQRKALPTWVDRSARDLPTMYVSAGRRGCDLGIAPEDLLALTGGSWAAIGR